MDDEHSEWQGARRELKILGDLVTHQIGNLRDQVSGMRDDVHDLGKTVTRLEEAASRAPVGFEAMGVRLATVEEHDKSHDKKIWGLVVGFLMLIAGIVLK